MQTTHDKNRLVRHFGYFGPLTDEIIDYYDSIVARDGDVILALTLAGNPVDARVLEIGCGLGREAEIITRLTPNYAGFEESKALIDKAMERAPRGVFSIDNPIDHDYGVEQYDVVFAFASLRYFNQDDMSTVLRKVRRALKIGGVFYVSLNHSHHYEEVIRQDRFGVRQIVYYNSEIIQRLAGEGFKRVHESSESIMGARWFEIALKRTV